MHYGATFICQLPSCNLFTQHVCFLRRDTTSETMAPGPIFLIDTTFFQALSSLFLFYAVFTFVTFHYSICLILSFVARPEDWQPSKKLGQEEFVCCVQVPRLLERQTASNLLQVFEVLMIDKLWFHNWGKLPLDYIIPSTWGSQRTCTSTRIIP